VDTQASTHETAEKFRIASAALLRLVLTEIPHLLQRVGQLRILYGQIENAEVTFFGLFARDFNLAVRVAEKQDGQGRMPLPQRFEQRPLIALAVARA
jgi:hypothetical protein